MKHNEQVSRKITYLPYQPVNQDLILTPHAYVDALVGAVGLEDPNRLLEEVTETAFLTPREQFTALSLLDGLVDFEDIRPPKRKVFDKAAEAAKNEPIISAEALRDRVLHEDSGSTSYNRLRRIQILRQRRTESASRRIALQLRAAAVHRPKEIPLPPPLPPRYGR